MLKYSPSKAVGGRSIYFEQFSLDLLRHLLVLFHSCLFYSRGSASDKGFYRFCHYWNQERRCKDSSSAKVSTITLLHLYNPCVVMSKYQLLYVAVGPGYLKVTIMNILLWAFNHYYTNFNIGWLTDLFRSVGVWVNTRLPIQANPPECLHLVTWNVFRNIKRVSWDPETILVTKTISIGQVSNTRDRCKLSPYIGGFKFGWSLHLQRSWFNIHAPVRLIFYQYHVSYLFNYVKTKEKLLDALYSGSFGCLGLLPSPLEAAD